MSGIQYMITGIFLLVFSSAGLAAAEWILAGKKKRIREQVYQLYD